jgi:hypothetical protein
MNHCKRIARKTFCPSPLIVCCARHSRRRETNRIHRSLKYLRPNDLQHNKWRWRELHPRPECERGFCPPGDGRALHCLSSAGQAYGVLTLSVITMRTIVKGREQALTAGRMRRSLMA